MKHAHLMLRSGDDVMMLDEQRTNSRYVCYFCVKSFTTILQIDILSAVGAVDKEASGRRAEKVISCEE